MIVQMAREHGGAGANGDEEPCELDLEGGISSPSGRGEEGAQAEMQLGSKCKGRGEVQSGLGQPQRKNGWGRDGRWGCSYQPSQMPSSVSSLSPG